MTMTQEAYCSFEVAKLLKEKGFNEPTKKVWYEHVPSQNIAHKREAGSKKLDYFYWDENTERNSLYTNDTNKKGMPTYITGKVYSAPTHQMATAWLRTKHIIIVVQPTYFSADGTCSQWGVDIWADDNYEKLQENYSKYEEAVEAALKYSLENLI